MSEASPALRARLLRQISRLNREHDLVEPGDRIMVACSGGKDSWAMLHLLRAYIRRLPFEASLVAMTLDQGQPGFDPTAVQQHMREHGFEFHLERRDTYAVVLEHTPPGKSYCSRCSRMRRAILHRVADRLGANKIALGHHRDDLVETLLLNQLFSGRLRAMAAKLPAPPGGHALVRPLLGCAEADLAAYAEQLGVPILPCNLCGTQPNSQRQQVKRLLATLEQQVPTLRQSLAAAVRNVEPTHLLDPRLSSSAEPVDPPLPPARDATDDPARDAPGDLIQMRSMRPSDFTH